MLENFRLKVFRAVAQSLSFRKAGEALYLTQPAVTLQIKTLEEELGARLFERSSSGVRLTEAGALLLDYAEQLHTLALAAENQLAGLKGEATGELILGASTTIAQYGLGLIEGPALRRDLKIERWFDDELLVIVPPVMTGPPSAASRRKNS